MLCWYTSFLSESQTECLDLHLPVHAPARLQPLQVSSTLSMLNEAKSKSCPNQSSPGQNGRKFAMAPQQRDSTCAILCPTFA